MSSLINNGWKIGTVLGNGMLIVLIAYLVTDIFKNRKMNIVQLFGKEFLILLLLGLLFMRQKFGIKF